MWKLKGGAKDALGDMSSIGAGADGRLWLLSDKSQRVARPGEHVEAVVADPIPKDRWVRA